MARHRVASTEDLDENERIIVEVQGAEIAVFHTDGDYHAVLNYCVHQSGPLCEGPLSGKLVADPPDFTWDYDDEPRVVTCPWHNWKFDIQTGENVRDSTYTVPTFETEVEDDEVYVIRG
ncbi:(2Fe-2S)-binding protein [Halobacteriales archaeon QS_1_68_17]|nr:MAG: (2Fe-2S)-binding protein [Halobacteriales archaeon QS_1_68_17]